MGFDIIGFSHIGFTVGSIEEFQQSWGEALGLTDWKIHEESSLGGIQLHGVDVGPLTLRVAFARLGGTSLELIQTTAGKTHHSVHLDRHGPGLHHVAFWVADIERELAKSPSLGLDIVMSPSSLHPKLRDRAVSAVTRNSPDLAIPKFFAFLDTNRAATHFALELLDAKFADDYRALNGPYPFYPGELPGG